MLSRGGGGRALARGGGGDPRAVGLDSHPDVMRRRHLSSQEPVASGTLSNLIKNWKG